MFDEYALICQGTRSDPNISDYLEEMKAVAKILPFPKFVG